MNVYIRRSEHVKKRHHKNFHSGSSVDIFSTSTKTSKRHILDVTLQTDSVILHLFTTLPYILLLFYF